MSIPIKTPDQRDVAALKAAITALNSTQHNPLDWAPIIRFVAPIVARIASRYVLRSLARRLGRRISQKIR